MQNLINKLVELMLSNNSLSYDFEEIKSKYHYEKVVELVDNNLLDAEIWCLSSELCGTSGHKMATNFMKNLENESYFLQNVSFNSEISNPLIMRAIQIRMQHINHFEDLKAEYELNSFENQSTEC